MRKLLVVVGAGASIDFGMPSVAEVGRILSGAAQKRFPLAHDPSTNLYDSVAGEIEAYWASFSKPALTRRPHFENVLYALLALASAYPHGDFTSPLGALVSPRPLPDVNWFGRYVQEVDGNVISNLVTDSADVIIDEFRARCQHLDASRTAELAEMRDFLAALASQFEVAVVTLNYDDVVYRCMPSIPVTGFGTLGVFDERLILERSDWSCFLHLHGSVHFDMRPLGHELHAVHWEEDLGAPFSQNAAGRSSVYSDEGMIFPQSVIVAGHGKTSQILRRPFRTYYSEVDRLVASSDALLCLGYGFGDEHLNMALNGYRDARSRPVVLIDWAARGQMSAGSADWDHPRRAVLNAMDTLLTPLHLMSAMGHSAPTQVDELIDTRSFDLSTDPAKPLAIWYNGMIEACRHPDLVLAQLG
jgi:hypothetical protein